ncbi:MAG TPA: 30S ribosomal protein S12 methylthiotransferase RimO [Streptosporangiaceae bacterium]|nr:30S ribosomal protein S12 methylthiotransferase RimO [Streptosporangiaceae bacterium]
MSRRTGSPAGGDRTVRLVTLGCARNEVDSEELAGRLETGGWRLTDQAGADVTVVNTCGFIQAAKQESIDELLDAASGSTKVVAAGCLAERYGAELAEALPEAQVLSFDDYTDIAARLDAVHAGQRWAAHQPRDRRKLLPLSPAARPSARPRPAAPGGVIPDLPDGVAPASGPRVPRRRLGTGVSAPLKIASGCDRRCSFCAIPSFRGAFLSRPAEDLLAEARWLAGQGVRELLLVSENSTSYGKDLGNLRLLEELLPALAAVDGIAVVRVSYLQPAELRPGLIDVLASTPGVAPYFDLSFQHASGSVLRAMRRFGDERRFCDLLERIRQACPEAGVRSNFIVGFPGETDDDVNTLRMFLEDARLDAIGIFGYSDEDGTEAASLPGKVDPAEIARRVEDVTALADELMSQRSADRIGQVSDVLLERRLSTGRYEGRAAHQAPEVDGTTIVRDCTGRRAGDLVRATFAAAEGADLVADAITAVPAVGYLSGPDSAVGYLSGQKSAVGYLSGPDSAR